MLLWGRERWGCCSGSFPQRRVSPWPRFSCSVPLCALPIPELDGEPGLIRANYGPLLADVPWAEARLSAAVLGHHQESSPWWLASTLLTKPLCVGRGGRLLATINLLWAGQGPWGPGMCRAQGLSLQGPAAPSSPGSSCGFRHVAPRAVCLPCAGSVLTWAWDGAPAALPPSLLQRKGRTLRDPGAGQTPSIRCSWEGQTLVLLPSLPPRCCLCTLATRLGAPVPGAGAAEHAAGSLFSKWSGPRPPSVGWRSVFVSLRPLHSCRAPRCLLSVFPARCKSPSGGLWVFRWQLCLALPGALRCPGTFCARRSWDCCKMGWPRGFLLWPWASPAPSARAEASPTPGMPCRAVRVGWGCSRAGPYGSVVLSSPTLRSGTLLCAEPAGEGLSCCKGCDSG